MMQAKYSKLSPAALVFPLALVLFEFAVYIANDMIQPAMLAVVHEFSASISWVPTSMTAFLLGGALMPWLTGPWSDRVGRRPVLLIGVAYFILSCLATYLVTSIEAFIGLRVLQGIGLCFINAVGYAAVQEAFEEKAAVKVTALMANVGLIAPMIGPIAGAWLVSHAPWRSCFLAIAAVSFIALVGLFFKMPETVKPSHEKLPLINIAKDYRSIFSNRRFVLSAFCIPLLALPLISWVAVSPIILVKDFGMSEVAYGLMQIPVFGGLILGNFAMVGIADRWPLGRSALVGMWPIMGGLCLMLGASWVMSEPQYVMVLGMMIFAFGEGLCFAVLYRFALMSSQVQKGTVSASMSMISMGGYAVGIELFTLMYHQFGVHGFAAMSVLTGLVFIMVAKPQISAAMQKRARAEAQTASEAAENQVAA